MHWHHKKQQWNVFKGRKEGSIKKSTLVCLFFHSQEDYTSRSSDTNDLLHNLILLFQSYLLPRVMLITAVCEHKADLPNVMYKIV